LIDVRTGDVAFVPRDTWHGLDNTGKENLLMAFQYSPAGFEEYFVENGTLVGMPAKVKTMKNMHNGKKVWDGLQRFPAVNLFELKALLQTLQQISTTLSIL
jgi:oxalate decarboxylase/phosphoglucose isomerase-like protein (cupin superfamily)